MNKVAGGDEGIRRNMRPRSEEAHNAGPLSGVRVVDLTTLVPGPLGSLLLADYGADVIKVEGVTRPDPERYNGPHTALGGSYRFGMLNRNKRALAVDLKSDGGRDALLDIIDGVDVVVEGFRPRTVDRLGIGYEVVSARNPGIVYCSLSGYGQTGPYAMLPGHDLNYLGATGTAAYFGGETDLSEGTPRPPRMPVADIGGGTLMAVFGILAALVNRARTGVGDYVDVSVFDGTFFWQSVCAQYVLAEGREPDRSELPTTGGKPGYGIYEVAGGELLSLSCLEPAFWRNLRAALELDELPIEQPTGAAAAPARALIADRLRDKDREAWLDVLRRHDVPAAPVLSATDAIEDPHVVARDLIQHTDLGDGVTAHIGFPVKFGRARASLRTVAPQLGEHTDGLLREAGYGVSQIEGLRRDGVIL